MRRTAHEKLLNFRYWRAFRVRSNSKLAFENCKNSDIYNLAEFLRTFLLTIKASGHPRALSPSTDKVMLNQRELSLLPSENIDSKSIAIKREC